MSNQIQKLKGFLRKSKSMSIFMGCPYPAFRWNRAVKRKIYELGAEAKILDLGSGTDRRAPNVITLEIEANSNVDIVGDGHQLPFHDNVFDAIINEAVLEHVLEPKQIVDEIYRVLKPGGYVCAAVPFLQGFHASPHDYQRYTVPGFNHLFSAFIKIESGACAGPTASLHWIFREYVGLMLSFGNLLAAKIISLIIGWLTFPIILIDYILMINKHSHILASAVYFVGQKEKKTTTEPTDQK
ncbi:TPA: SAM-dependent methyltransferase [Candidatus Poribacteria bacterium]|nr:SAM-dependent methyltransferase [Candidatus Poribacteria bacterium]HIA68533.1 SAM-dependent methyltransferase [Candidatus Poribacteria bacterium]HIB91158.1 SAM-dependent methyltransferase [Candidatus Poribacteria bacterium]HIB98576.1 SAM-dependent methyltransferase [Candidatus Poribacteria bacterium]HIM09524.1 SAM-dependent methyltransferase [Candidatus Poribacteria bacterium]